MFTSSRFWDTIFFSNRFNTYVYCHVSFSAVDIIISKEEEIFSPKILMMETTISFFVRRFGCLEAEQKPVLTSLSRNCRKLLCTETRIAQPPNQVHWSSIRNMKDNGQGYLFGKKGLYLFRFLLKRYILLKLGKNRCFSNTCQPLSFLSKHIFWKILLPQHYICWILLEFDLH